ncbi:MAG: hypothetical protein HY730_05350 [Candidatus Tectomicrobia bacterium]|uniref:Uncharacterized protein n=1 Tax=Tectimicrobiota bacterium TaxID=2528274 RepID=A0A933GNI7_UNCTE|nr:hypothetical protein [Candidatus Tectomicrobia bacterium]
MQDVILLNKLNGEAFFTDERRYHDLVPFADICKEEKIKKSRIALWLLAGFVTL